LRLLTQDLDFIENRMAGIVASAGAKQIQSGLLNPLQLPGLQLWLDGADPLGSGIAPANTTLSTWADKSGNGRNATGFGSPPYVSANRSVSMNGSQYYTIPYAGTHSTESIFFVLTCTNVSSAQILLVGNVSGTRQIVQLAPQIGVTGVSNNASCGNPSINTLSMLEFTFNSSDTFAYLNGTPGSRGDGMNPGYESFLYLGCSLSVGTFFTGTISEVLIYNQFLSTYQRQAIEGYLAWKWNIISSLPANHPYRNSAASPSVISTNFFPTYISGIQLWLDGADPLNTSVAPANGTIISTWADKSGNARNATSLRSPVFNTSSNAILLNGSDQGFSFTYSGVHPTETAFMVLNMSSPISVQTFMTSQITYARQFNTNMGQINLRQTNIGTNATTPSTLTASSNTVLGYSLNSSESFVYFNGTAGPTGTGFGSLPSESNIRIGYESDGAYHLSGSISEILIYDKVLTTSERQVVEGYLAWKWNIQTSLLSNHPFRYSAPNSLSISGMTNYSYSPSYLPGLTAWYDAADPLGTGFQPANGTVISTWVDKTSESLNPMIATGSPTYTTGSQNGLPGITISGNSGFNMTNYFQAYVPSGTFLSELNAFVVYKNTSRVDYNTVITRSSTAAQYNAPLDMYNSRFYAGVYPGSYAELNSSFDLYNTTTSILNVTLTQSTQASSRFTAYRNGTGATLTLTGGSNLWIPSDTGTHLYLGTRGDKYTGFNGIFYEAMVFNYPLTPSGRQYVEGYLAWKWGLQNSLPTTHPYYAAAPSITSLFFQPSQIFGLNLWLDGADPLNTGILPANGTTISTWFDKSPNAFLATSIASPTYNLTTRTITLNGSSQYFTVPYGGSHPIETGFFVVNVTTPSQTYPIQFFLLGNSGNGARDFIVYANNIQIQRYNSQNLGYTTTNNVPAGSFGLYGYTYNSNAGYAYLNGVVGSYSEAWTQEPTSDTGSFIGNSLASSFAEVILFNTVLTITERQVVEGYLAWKWGIQASLQPQHPYKNFQPSLLTFAPSFINTSTSAVNFQPTQISGLNLWLDGADPLNTSVAPANGTIISTWADKSGNSRNATSVGSPVFNTSSNAIVLNGSSQGFSFTYPGVHPTETGFFVVNMTTPNSYAVFINSPISSGRQFYDYNTQLVLGQYFIGTNATTTSTLTANSNTVLGYSLNSSNSFLYFNGTAGPTGTGFNNLPSESTIFVGYSGSGQFLGGTISEILIYDKVLTTSERQQVEGYLAWKWGTQVSLPLAHPYKNIQPSNKNTLAIIANADAFLPLQSNTIDYAKTEQIVGSNGTLSFSNVLGKNCIFINGSTSNYISLPIANPPVFTFAFWFNYTNTQYFTVASYTTPAGALAMQFDLVSAGSNTVYTALPNQWTIAPSSSNLGVNTWNFIAVTVNQSTYVENVYMNGVFASTATGTGAFPNSPSLMVLGKSGDGTVFPSGGNRSYQGYLQNFMYFNTILTGAQINAIYNQTAIDLARASQPTSLSLSFANSTLSLSWTAGLNTTSYVVNFYGVSANTNVGGLLLTTVTTTSTSATYNPGTFTYYYATVIPTNSGFLGTIATSSQVARPIPAQPTSLVLSFIDPKLYLSWTAGANTTSYNVNFYGNTTNSNSGGTLLATFNPSVTNQEYTPSNIMSYSYYYATVTPMNSGDSGTMATTSALRVLDLGINYRGSYNNSTGYVVNDLILNNDAAQSTAGGGILDNKYYIRVPPNMGALTGFAPGSAGAGTTTANGYGGWWRLYIPGIGLPSLSYSNPTLTFSWGADANTSYSVSFYGVSTVTNTGGVLLTTITTSSKPVTYNPATYTYYYASVQPFITGINGVTISSLPIART